MTNLHSKLKCRDITLPTKVHIVKSLVFPIVLCGCENWTIKKAECQETDTFELCCWRRLLKVPWTARRSNQSILKEINPEYSLEGLMLKLKLQHFGHLMWRADSWEKTLKLGKIEGKRRSRWQRTICLDDIADSMDMSLSKLREIVKDRGAWYVAVRGSQRAGRDSNWGTTTARAPEQRVNIPGTVWLWDSKTFMKRDFCFPVQHQVCKELGSCHSHFHNNNEKVCHTKKSTTHIL